MNNAIKAGAAKVCINPPLDWFPMFNKRNFLGGGPDSYFGGISDDLFVKALVVENGEERILIVCWDLIALPYPVHDMREIAAEAAGVSYQNVLFTCTHNHNAITCENKRMWNHPNEDFRAKVREYLPMLREWLAECCRKAAADLQPAKIGFGRGDSYINVNRHVNKADGKFTIAGFERDRYSDRELSVLRVDDMNDEPICILFNYGVHASLLANNKPDGQYTRMSADFVGVACKEIEAAFDNKPVAIYTPGASGDQNAVLIARVYDVLDDASSVMHDFGAAGPVVCDFMGKMMARDVLKIYKTIDTMKDHTRIWTTKRNVPCPKEALHPTAHIYEDFILELTLFMFGDIAICGTSGEFYAAIGRRLKDGSPYRNVMFITICGPMPGDYIRDDSGDGIAEGIEKKNFYEMMDEYSNGDPGGITGEEMWND